MATIEQTGRGRQLAIKGGVGVAGLNEFLRNWKKVNPEIGKAIRRVNIEISKEVASDAVKKGRVQNVLGRPVHRRDLAVRGIKGRARQNQASVEIQGHKNNAVLSLEFGRKFINVPTNSKKLKNNRVVSQTLVGRLPNSRPGARPLYRKYVGANAFITQKGGYVVGTTIADALPSIQRDYLNKVSRAIEKTLEMNKVVDIPIRISSGGTTGLARVPKAA
jgi:hypothetical protein